MTRPNSDRWAEADGEIPDTWIETANSADFRFYEVAEPQPRARWAGGYGWGDGRAASLEILCLVGDAEVSVETYRQGSTPEPSIMVRMLVGDLIRRLLFDGAELDLTTPKTWTLRAGPVVIAVDSDPVNFDGIWLNEIWAGAAMLAEGATLVVHAAEGAVPSSLRTCDNWAMGDRPPPEATKDT